MRPKRVCKVKALGVQKDKEWFISTIHKLGSLHIRDVSEQLKDGKLQADVPLQEVERISDLLLRVNFLADVFSTVGHKGVRRHVPTSFTLNGVANEAKRELAGFEGRVVEAFEALKKVDGKIGEVRRSLQLAEKFEIDDVAVRESSLLRVVHGRVLRKDFDGFHWPKEAKKSASVLIKPETKDVYAILVVYLQSAEEEVAKAVRALNVEREKAPLPDRPVAELQKELKELKKVARELRSSLHVLAEKHDAEVAYLHDLLTLAKERCEIATRFGRTEKLFYVEAFVPVKKMGSLADAMQNRTIILEREDVKEGPILLENPPYVKAFERITTMFGYPSYNGVDPTFFVSIFFPFFFGFMLSDVGYGAMVLLAAALFFFLGKRNAVLRDVAVIAAACGVLTVTFGFLFGAFFGSLIKVPALWLDPFDQSMLILATAIGVGVLHANLGIGISMFTNITGRNWKSLLLDNGSLLLLEAAVIFYALQNAMAGSVLLGASALLLVVKSSVFGIMEISGFAGLILSYARILALSLATGGIALAVNIIAEQLFGLGMAGIIFAPLVLIGGHAVNFVLNIIGATVNSARLHFVEFFSLFFVEGGEKFTPFKVRR